MLEEVVAEVLKEGVLSVALAEFEMLPEAMLGAVGYTVGTTAVE